MHQSKSFGHLKPFGYAPGNYMVRCHACDGVFDFMDKYANTCRSCAENAWASRQAVIERKLAIALEALEEIALAGMSGTGVESEEHMTQWHARRAWQFIGIAARGLEKVKNTK